MSTLQISAPVTANAPTEAQRPGSVLRVLRAVVEAIAQANHRRAEREIARIAHRYGLKVDRI
ncbi:hypothetical protein [Microvirga sp. VF16]|uniref:hypothetical protein n=1 Tax=Microvirga sp. VF16 TaxID=2807101 RepID=UPI00193DE4AA|nr:hypothetical protein [Microvirga sp. VF16]QRM31302.1 hypothetical protein JO965_10100 [Microvirga sp. VF16]